MPSFAMKVYDLQWFTTFGMSYDEAAQGLVDDGIDTVLLMNRIDPLPQSGVDQTAYLRAFDGKLAEYDDRAWMETLRAHGLRVLQTSAVLFDPPSLEQFPDARPVDASGEPDRGIDWYTGICPTDDGYLARKLGLIAQASRELQPDGFFLQFMRYPGFWENWTWAPDYEFTDADQFCFCDRCRTSFASETGISLPTGTIAEQSQVILREHREAWLSWRSARVAEIVGRARAAVAERSPLIMLNTLPFPRSDFGGSDVRREIAAQDLALLAGVVDRFELMTYLQILNRPLEWLRESIEDARAQLPADKEIVCTLQVDQLYTTGVHEGRGRAPAVTAEDIGRATRTALDAGADGVVFYHWTDFLTDAAAGGSKRQVLRALTHG